MSRALRLQYPGMLLHIHSRGNDKRLLYLDDGDRFRFVDLMGQAVKTYNWILYAYVLMPNHYHLFLQLVEETLSDGMRFLNGEYARLFNKRHRRVGHLFQGRYKAHNVEEETYFLQVLRYLVLNPVRAGIVERPEQFEWSSHRAVIGEVDTPWVAVDDVLIAFAPERAAACSLYRNFVNEGIGITTNPFDNLVGQQYLGSEAWCKSMREKVELKPRADEFPLQQRAIGRPAMLEVISAVARAVRVNADAIRHGHGGHARMLSAWIAVNEGLLKNAEIAAALRLRSSSHVSELVRRCEREFDTDTGFRRCLDECLSTLRRQNRQPQT